MLLFIFVSPLKAQTKPLARDHGSEDIFIDFSPANPGVAASKGLRQLTMLPNDEINPIFWRLSKRLRKLC